LFATHYHELQALEEKYPSCIKNYQVAVDESSGDPIFLHKVTPGAADHSFGIAVAKLAGVPEEVCNSATQILRKLEEEKLYAKLPVLPSQLHPIDPATALLDKLSELDVSRTTPLEALNLLSELKKLTNV
jgi:DNA mismatch repair protein MutS